MDLRARTTARRLGETVTTALFALAVVLPLGARFLDPDADASVLPERRAPAPAPSLARGLRRLPREVDGWVNDHFGFRGHLIRAHNAIKLFGFGTAPTDQLLVGRDGWLFTTSNLILEAYRGAFRLNEAELELWRRTLEDRRDWLAQRGIAYVLVIAPDKTGIYPEKVPPSLRRAEAVPFDQLLAHMEERSDVRLVDLRPGLRAAKSEDRPGDTVYYPHGSHWSERGVLVAYRAVLARLRELLPQHAPAFEPWDDADFERRAEDGVGDKWNERLHLVGLLPERNVRMVPRRARRAERVTPEGLDGEVYVVADADLPRGLLIHDSFGVLLQRPLAEHFARLRAVSGLDLDTALVLEERPDAVIQVMAERRLAAYRPPSTSLAREDAARARFEASREVLLALDEPHELRALDPWRHARLEPGPGSEDPLLVRTIAGGQGFLVPPLDLPPGTVPVLKLDLTTRRATALSVLYQTSARRDYVASRAVTADLVEGRNVVYLEVPAPDLAAPLLILPGRERGRYELRAVEARAAPLD